MTALFAEIANEIANEFMLHEKKQNLPLDTTSLKLSGGYDVDVLELDKEKLALPMFGHSKDYHPPAFVWNIKASLYKLA